ncbi:MAG: PhoH family protein [Spirochaetales bacterium]|nr:PhoH family protein [Spirochaetales bacterium]
MSTNLAVILDDSASLKSLCGAQDENLKLIEELLGVEIYTRGNEIQIVSESSAVQRKFETMIEKILEYIDQGMAPDPDTIKVLFQSIDEKDKSPDFIKNKYIKIPGRNRIMPRTYRQAKYIEGMDKHDVVFCYGPAGTGKTFLAVAHALKEVLEKKKRKLVLTRPVVEAGESLGYLPGDLEQKVSPYLRPLYDAMDYLLPGETISRMQENRIIEIAPLAYMRGRSLTNSYIILDEAQNTTREQMKMFLTRMGEGSKMVVTGDITQIDLPRKDRSGLIHAANLLNDIADIGFYEFKAQDVVRHPLVKKIIDAYEAE